MAEKFKVPFLGEIPLVQSVSEAGDGGQPIALDKNSIMSKIFVDLAQKVAQQIAINNGIAK